MSYVLFYSFKVQTQCASTYFGGSRDTLIDKILKRFFPTKVIALNQISRHLIYFYVKSHKFINSPTEAKAKALVKTKIKKNQAHEQTQIKNVNTNLYQFQPEKYEFLISNETPLGPLTNSGNLHITTRTHRY